MNGKTIDSRDRQILALLQDNARLSNAAMARELGMAPSAVLERIRKLERKGVILGYQARIDPKALGLGLTAFTFVRAEEPVGSIDSGQYLAELPEVMEVHHCAGQDAYLIKSRVADTEALGELLRTIGRNPAVRDTHSTVVLATVKETLAMPAGQAEEDDDGHEQA